MRATVLAPFNLTERQARFLATVMLHSGVFVGRQYAAFAGITHGQKVHDLVEKLLVRRFVTAIELGSTGRTRIFHVHHKPLYAAIGEPEKASASDRATDASAWQSWWQRAQPTFRVKTREAELDLQAFLTCPL